MPVSNSDSLRIPLIGTITSLALGCLFGAAFAGVSASDLRWAIALTAGIFFLLVLLVIPAPRRFLWILFILSFQLQDPSVRLLYGHAGSDGILVTLPAILGALYLLILAGSGGLRGNSRFQWLGPVGLPFIALLAISVVSLLHSDERFLGVTNLLVQVQVYFVYLLALNSVRSEQDLELSLKVLYVALAIQCAVYFFEWAFNISYISITEGVVRPVGPYPVRPGGTLGTNPFSFTNFALPIMFVLFATILPVRPPGTAPRWKSTLLVALGMAAIGLTVTRSAYANLFLGLLCVVALGYHRRSVSVRKAMAMFGVAALVAILITPLITKRLERESMKDSYNERAALMQMAAKVIEAHPIIGVGPGAYEASYKHYLTLELEDKWQWMVHNHYLLRTAEVGLFGGAALIVFLLTALRKSWSLTASSHPTVRALALACTAMVVTTAHQMYWDQWTHVPAQMLFWFLLGLSGAAQSMNLKPVHAAAASPREPTQSVRSSFSIEQALTGTQ
jgi:O-antigen ligase